MKSRPDTTAIQNHRPSKLVLQGECLALPAQSIDDGSKARAMAEHESHALPEVRSRIERDRDMVELIGTDTADLQAVANRFSRKASPVFDATESLFLSCSNYSAVLN